MNPQQANTAHSLYALYETLPNEVQQAFLEELLQKKQQELEDLAFALACKQAKEENQFLNGQEAQGFIQSLSQ
ncbi:MAG: hypothetical protein PHH59_15980 [Methylovulum sp.]|uniref:hypothetical protein n=1 Tax=Methylovulum sp. TaxID=1916980 RepID=UPI002609A1B6|nr:hypothetical protein [Methylovulum sp.]MDD2725506.1 hypothetical protein [Methylovulum sp.]MDD5126102.1 hypothetical protein [Methylovulum sp.]